MCRVFVCVYVMVRGGQCLQDTSQYVLSELAALEAEQKHIDSRAAVVERRLRSLMETGDHKLGTFSSCARHPVRRSAPCDITGRELRRTAES